ncbi:hypothetical protein ACFQY9_12515 [Microvirga aerilata]|uniref:hypothetical protein n=1 Tax=Microvirga aerilata TaxID=670292 RepID=UPI00362B7BF3
MTDTGNGTSVSREVTGRQAVTVGAVADAPEVHAGAAAGQEDGAVELDLSAALVDRDGSETLSVSILGLPDGFRLSHGSRAGDGSWHVAPADLAWLTLTPPTTSPAPSTSPSRQQPRRRPVKLRKRLRLSL